MRETQFARSDTRYARIGNEGPDPVPPREQSFAHQIIQGAPYSQPTHAVQFTQIPFGRYGSTCL